MLRTQIFPYQVDDEIVLYPVEIRFAPEMFALVDRNRAYLRQYQNWPDRIITMSDMRALIRHAAHKAEHGDGIDTLICYRDHPVGKIGLVQIDWTNQMCEIGYWLIEAAQGRGIITRSCYAIVDYAINQLNLNRVDIRCAAENTRSRAIPERMGFRFMGKLSMKIWLHGAMQDEVLYSMSRTRWRTRMLLHITTHADWQAAQHSGVYRAASLDTQGFIHLSTQEQVIRVANAVYAGQSNLVLLVIDPTRLTAPLKYEPPDPAIPAHHYDGELFPHVYGEIPVSAVANAVDFPPDADGNFSLPKSQ